MVPVESAVRDGDRLSALTTEAGAFAMVAIDQREALRVMLRDARGGDITDADLTRFKVTAARILSPYASGMLVDRQFGLDAVLAEHAVAPSCGLIASGDSFVTAHGELVGEVLVDRSGDVRALKVAGVVALKLLVLYRPDVPAEVRVDQVERFTELCREAGLLSIIEPVSRKPLDGSAWDATEGILAAATELGALGADLYKTEVPFHGENDDDAISAACDELSTAVTSPWVILSSGVAPDTFPRALTLACRAGASGFLAGRAVWAPSLAAEDLESDLKTNAVDRLRRLVEIADREVRAFAASSADS